MDWLLVLALLFLSVSFLSGLAAFLIFLKIMKMVIKFAFRLALIALLSFILAAALLAFYAFYIEPDNITVSRMSIDGTGTHMKIIFMSDFQRANADPAFIQRAVDIANNENADLILLGGDYVEYNDSELPSVAPLRSLRAKDGVYGVLGNHDYGVVHWRYCPGNESLAKEITDYLEENGTINVLGNENTKVDGITLITLDDLWACKRNESEAYAGTASSYRILLSHNQEELAISNSTADLYLFGHTHCGQIRFPFIGAVAKYFGMNGDYDSGHYLVNGSHVYTTCGLAWGPRLLAPPEVTVIELN